MEVVSLNLLFALVLHWELVKKHAADVIWSRFNLSVIFSSVYLSVCLFSSELSAGSSAVMAAEVVKHFFPKLVDLHNYIPANSTQQKLSNWNVLNRQDKRTLYFDHLMQSFNFL